MVESGFGSRELAVVSSGRVIVAVVKEVVKKKKVLFHPTMDGVILRLGTLPEPWQSENTSEDLRYS